MSQQSSDYKLIRCAVWDCIHAMSFDLFDDQKIIWADQDGKRPETPYITLRINPKERLSRPMRINDKGNIKTIIKYGFNLSIQSFGNCSIDRLWALEERLNTKSLIDECAMEWCKQGVSMSIIETRPIQDLSAVLESTHENRGIMDVRFNTSICRIDTGRSPDGLGVKKLGIEMNLKGKETITKSKPIIES